MVQTPAEWEPSKTNVFKSSKEVLWAFRTNKRKCIVVEDWLGPEGPKIYEKLDWFGVEDVNDYELMKT